MPPNSYFVKNHYIVRILYRFENTVSSYNSYRIIRINPLFPFQMSEFFTIVIMIERV